MLYWECQNRTAHCKVQHFTLIWTFSHISDLFCAAQRKGSFHSISQKANVKQFFSSSVCESPIHTHTHSRIERKCFGSITFDLCFSYFICEWQWNLRIFDISNTWMHENKNSIRFVTTWKWMISWLFFRKWRLERNQFLLFHTF